MSTTFDYANLPYGAGGKHRDHNRFNWRAELLLARNKPMIAGKRVLDLACNTGRLSYPCLELGAEHVVGVEGREELIEKGRRHLEGTAHAARMEWVHADLFDHLDSASPGDYDTILCFGFLYHTVRQVDFFRAIHRLRPDHVIIDTSVAKNYRWIGRRNFLKRPPALFVSIEDPTKSSDTLDPDGVVFFPSPSFLEQMFEVAGYRWRRIRYRGQVDDWAGLEVYRRGLRASYSAERV